MESQAACCAPGTFLKKSGTKFPQDETCTSCPTGYLSAFGEEFCNACNVCKKQYSAAGATACKTCGSSPGEYWVQKQDAVTGECISCPTGRVLAAEGIPLDMRRRRLQIPGGDSESDNYNQRKLGMKTHTRKLAAQMNMKTSCEDYMEKQCDICDSKPQQQQK